MLHDAQAAPETRAIRDRRPGQAESLHDGVADAKQVFTTDAGAPAGLASAAQSISSDKQPRPAAPSSYDEYGRPRRRSRKPDTRGGWGHTTELSAQEVRYLHEAAYHARSAGTPWNYRIDMRAPNGLSPKAGKRWLQVAIARVGQALQRQGFEHIGTTVFERKPHDDFVHCHHALHVSAAALPIIQRLCDGDAVRLQRWHRNALGYMTKQRQQLPPEYERRLPRGLLWKRQQGDIIPGRRLHLTKAQKAMMPDPMPARRRRPDDAYVAERRSFIGTTVPIAPEPSAEFCEALNLTAEPNPPRAAERAAQGRFLSGDSGETVRAGEANPLAEQLPLPMVAPVIDLAAIAEAKRKDLGLSQREAARMLGIRQPHWSNSINRRHDRFSAWRQNRLREFADDRVAA